MWNTTNLICSAPQQVAHRCLRSEQLTELTRTSIVLTCGGTALFGLILGGQRGYEQSLMAGLKLPVAWFMTLTFCIPAFYALGAALNEHISVRSLIALTLAATARVSVVLFALAPLLWLFTDAVPDTATGYHQVMFAVCCMYLFSGCFGVMVLLRAVSRRLRSWFIMLGFAGVFALVAGQTAWMLRPFVGRPAQQDVPWFRSPEGTFLEALSDTSRSARGEYDTECE